MDLKSKYKTKQRECLIAYLKTIPGQHFTAADICEYFKPGENPSVSPPFTASWNSL